jgi:hypothetical protein
MATSPYELRRPRKVSSDSVRSPTREASRPPVAKQSPTFVRHARVLVSSWGIERARQIAHVNSLLNGNDPYWSLVLGAIAETGRGAADAPTWTACCNG